MRPVWIEKGFMISYYFIHEINEAVKVTDRNQAERASIEDD